MSSATAVDAIVLKIRPDPFLEPSLPKEGQRKQACLDYLRQEQIFCAEELLTRPRRELPELVRPFREEVALKCQRREKARQRLRPALLNVLPAEASAIEIQAAQEYAPPALPATRTISSGGLRARQAISVTAGPVADSGPIPARMLSLAGALLDSASLVHGKAGW